MTEGKRDLFFYHHLSWILVIMHGVTIILDPKTSQRIIEISISILPCKKQMMTQYGQIAQIFFAASLISCFTNKFALKLFSLAIYGMYICNFYNPLVDGNYLRMIYGLYDILVILVALHSLIIYLENQHKQQMKQIHSEKSKILLSQNTQQNNNKLNPETIKNIKNENNVNNNIIKHYKKTNKSKIK